MRFISSSLMLSGVLALTMVGCGNGGDGGDASVELGITAQALEAATLPSAGAGSGSGSGSGSDSQKHLVITVNQVKLHVAATGAGEDSGRSGWKMAFSGETKVDLFDATTVEALLGTIDVPAGKITQVRLMLSAAELVEGETRTPVTCSSCSETGLKIILGGKIDVVEGDRLHLSLDVDQALSLTHDETGYRLAPVIKLVKHDED
jgi:hypothetical protein